MPAGLNCENQAAYLFALRVAIVLIPINFDKSKANP